MSKKKEKKNQWGGLRNGAGRHPGLTKAKICVSVDEANWETAVKRWKGKGSRLIDELLTRYVMNEVKL
jgi:hypothetical protein